MTLAKDKVTQLKNKLLFDQIMTRHKFSKMEIEMLRREGLDKMTNWGDVIIPKKICELGGYGYRDEHGRDAQDNSEIKVIGVNPLTGRVEISNLRTKNGQKKIGDLRIIIANMKTWDTICCYVPKNNWYLWKLSDNGHGVGRICATFNKEKNTIQLSTDLGTKDNLLNYKCESFEEMCKKTIPIEYWGK